MKHLWSLALVGLFAFTSCSNENEVIEQQQQDEQTTENITAFVSDDTSPNSKAATRTMGIYTGSSIKFYWTSGDKLWIKSSTLKQSFKDDIAERIAVDGNGRTDMAKFYFRGIYSDPTYLLRYTGNGNNLSDKVTIKTSQSQQTPNDARHLGTDGDCGTATAHRQGDGSYKFMLDHKAAYLTFMPYYSRHLDPTFTPGFASSVKVTQVKVNADQPLCGTYEFDDTGIKLATATSTSKSVTLTLNGGGTNGFSIPTAADYRVNAAIMVIAPGSYTNFTVEYTLHDQKTNVTGTVKKNYGNITCHVGKNKKIAPDLDVADYSNTKWTMWDAKQSYWQGHEGTQARVDGETGTNYPTLSSDPRWHSTSSSEATNLCAHCPNANEMCWYISNGDAHWDETKIWTVWGHLYHGGMWFLKKAYISSFNSAKWWDQRDWRVTNGMGQQLNMSNRITTTPIAVSEQHKYFYLPAIENMDRGNWAPVGVYGTYWTSTPIKGDNGFAYSLVFAKNLLVVQPRWRFEGDVFRAFE